jgi:tetratricopeptide (TPR) repeat protein
MNPTKVPSEAPAPAKGRGPNIVELYDRLRTARSELSPTRARSLLQSIRVACKGFVGGGTHVVQAATLGREALDELALMENVASVRAQLRQEAIALCEAAHRRHPVTDVVVAYIASTLDLLRDTFVANDPAQTLSLLANTQRLLEQALAAEPSPQRQSRLLTLKSMVLRRKVAHEEADLRRRRSEEAVRCARKASELDADNSQALVQHALARWDTLRWQTSSLAKIALLNAVEELLRAAYKMWEPGAASALADFYRLTSRPAQAIEILDESFEGHDVRRRLRVSPLYAEAALDMHELGYPQRAVQRALDDALHLLRSATDAGYENAKMFVDLASIEAMQGDLDVSVNTLRHLARDGMGTWTEIVEHAKALVRQGDRDAISRAFALGVGDADVWARLGAYALDHVRDAELSVQLVQTALMLSPHLAQGQMLLARAQTALGGRANLDRAEHNLRIAARAIHRGLLPWRAVRLKLRHARGLSRIPPFHEAPHLLRRRSGFTDVQRAYQELQRAADWRSARPDAAAQVVRSLLDLTCGFRATSSIRGVGIPDTYAYEALRGAAPTLVVVYGADAQPTGAFIRNALESCTSNEPRDVVFIVWSRAAGRPVRVDAACGACRALVVLTAGEFETLVAGEIRPEALFEKRFLEASYLLPAPSLHPAPSSASRAPVATIAAAQALRVVPSEGPAVAPPAVVARAADARTTGPPHRDLARKPRRSAPDPARVFVCYAREDKNLLERLRTHLSVLEHYGQIRVWYDRLIPVGSDWEQEIQAELVRADIIILLISAYFFNSKYCREVELAHALEGYHAGRVQVVPVLLRPCDWQGTDVAALQILPRDGVPVLEHPDPDTAWTAITREVRGMIDTLPSRH